MEARHQEILVERAVNEEVNHHLLKLLMLKHPEKFAELDWIFPKLARWVALRRQAEKNVAERHRLAAAAAIEGAALSIPDKKFNTTHEPGLFELPTSPLPSTSLSIVLETSAISCKENHDLCSISSSDTAVRSIVCKRTFDQTISSTDDISYVTSQNPDASSSDRPYRHHSKSSSGTRSNSFLGAFAFPPASSFTRFVHLIKICPAKLFLLLR